MDYRFDPGAEQLRRRLRELIDAFFPEDFLGAFTEDPANLALTQQFCKILAAEGLLAISWPTEFGGGGASVWDQTVVREEMWAHHEPRGPQYMGINWVGPTIMRFGTPAQQQKHLPPIAAGDVIWCQGFSEPDAGSDLSSLRTEARAAGGGWVVNGQKVWTSYAPIADWCMLAARTSKSKRPHDGISLFMVPMDRPGITVQPIDSLLGPYHLNEVFFDDVTVHPDELLGDVDGGWQIIREALTYERVGIARYARCERLLGQFRAAFSDTWERLGDSVKEAWISALLSARTARLLAYRTIDQQAKGITDSATASRTRIAITLCDQETAEMLGEALGPDLLPDGSGAPLHGAFEDHWRYAQAATVAGGTLEMQLTLVARDVLGGDRS